MIDALLPASPPIEAHRWQQGVAGDVHVGDMWVVSWDGEALGLVVIAAVRADHVLIWPVSDPAVTPSAPCFTVTTDWITGDLYAWPEAEAGMSKAVLDRRMGAAVRDRTMLAIRLGMVDGDWPEDVAFAPSRDDEEADAALDRVCRFASGLCDIEWTTPEPGMSPVDVTWAQEHDLAGMLNELVQGPPAVVRDLAAGLRPLPVDLVETVAARFNVAWTDILAPISGDEVAVLNDPSRKHVLLDISSRLKVGEADARRRTWHQSLRAARQQAGGAAAQRVESRVDQALEDLLADSER